MFSLNIKYDKFCRTCLQRKDFLIPIFQTQAAQKLNYCGFWTNPCEDDGFPYNICINCEDLLEKCYDFKKQCENSYLKLSHQDCETQDKNQSFKNQEQPSDPPELQRASDRSQEQFSTSLSHHIDTEDSNDNTLDDNDHQDGNLEIAAFLSVPLPPPLPFLCNKCTLSFNTASDLEIHQSIHTNEGLKCLKCEKVFSGRQRLKRHVKIHMSSKPHICHICGKTYSESHALTKHLRIHSGIPRPRKYICEQCGQRFQDHYYLRIHMRKHTGERPLQCLNCNKSFSDPRSLSSHKLIHTGERPYHCQVCTKSYIQSASLTKHLRVHSQEKLYMCNDCGKFFKQSSSLNRHKKIHEVIEEVAESAKCNLSSKLLGKHEKTKQVKHEFLCNVCAKKFTRNSTLRLHMMMHGFNNTYEKST